MDANQLDAMLAMLLQPDNNLIQQGEQALTQLTKDPSSMLMLLDRLMNSPNEAIRHLAAVVTRRRIFKAWGKLSAEQRTQAKTILQQRMHDEPNHLVRRGVVDVVGAIAKLTLPANEWPELLPFLFQCSQSQQPEHRQTAIELFTSLTDSIPHQIEQHLQPLQNILLKSLEDQAVVVRSAGLKAVSRIASALANSDSTPLDPRIVPLVITVARDCLSKGDEDNAIQAFEIFDELLEQQHPVVKTHIPQLIPFALEVACVQKLELQTRQKALSLISWVSCYHPRTITRSPDLVQMILIGVFSLACEPVDEDDDDEDEPAFRFALETLDQLATSVPSKFIMPAVAQFVKANVADPRPEQRRGAIAVIGMVSEGCAETMKDSIDTILPWVVSATEDPDANVRSESCHALCLFSEYLQPEIADHHSTILPGLLKVMNDPTPAVRALACTALETIAEHLGAEIVPYLEALVTTLLAMMQTNDRRTQETAVSAIASAAAAAEEHFVVHVEAVFAVMFAFMNLTDEEDMTLRARATECVGIICATIGKERAMPLIQQTMPLAMAGMENDHPELREFTFGYFSNLVEIMGGSFAPVLPQVMPLVFQSIASDDGMIANFAEDETAAAAGRFNLGGDDESDDDDDGGNPHSFSVRTAALDEKSSAIHCLGTIAEKVGDPFMAFMGEALTETKRMLSYYHTDARQNAATALAQLLQLSFNAQTVPHRATAEAKAAAAQNFGVEPLHPDTATLLQVVMVEYLQLMQHDEDKETVARVCEGLGKVTHTVGAGHLNSYMPEFSKMLGTLVAGKALCQQVEDEEEANDDDDDHDQVLIDAVGDVIGVLADAFKVNFVPYFDPCFNPLLKYMKANRPASDRIMAIGTVAEVCMALGPACAQYVQPMLPILHSGFRDSSSDVRRNSVFCIGVMCENLGGQMASLYGDLLPILSGLIEDPSNGCLRDNAVSSVWRLVKGSSAHIPLEQVLPVITAKLPLREDATENATVIRCIAFIYGSQPQILGPYIQKIVEYFGELMGDAKLNDDLKSTDENSIKEMLVALQQQFPEPIAQVLASLPPANAAALQALVARA